MLWKALKLVEQKSHTYANLSKTHSQRWIINRTQNVWRWCSYLHFQIKIKLIKKNPSLKLKVCECMHVCARSNEIGVNMKTSLCFYGHVTSFCRKFNLRTFLLGTIPTSMTTTCYNYTTTFQLTLKLERFIYTLQQNLFALISILFR